GGGDDPDDPRRAAAPRRRSLQAVPGVAPDHVVAVRQGVDVVSHTVLRAGTDEAVVGGDDSDHPRGPTAPGHGPAVAVPDGTLHHVVAVRQGDDTVSHIVARAGTEKAVGGGHNPDHPRRPTAPGHGPAVTVPDGALHHVVAVRQDGDAG